jgi:hypothetical protein
MGKTRSKQPVTPVTEQELQQRWAARCASGTFSAGVQGVGTIRVMGKAGDAPITFPRITSLDALGTLEPDEQWAVQAAQALVTQARAQERTVFNVLPAEAGVASQPQAVTTFDPNAESLMIVSMIRGG